MSRHYPRDHFLDATVLPTAPVPSPSRAHRSFDLHPALFAATLVGYLAFIALMAITFWTGEMAIPVGIFVITIVAGFVVPALWARVEGPKVGHLPDWQEFLREEIDTWSGRLSGKEAATQVLIMPAMLLLWGVAVAVVRACV